MKRFSKNFVFFIMTISMPLFFVSCSDDDDDNNGKTPRSVQNLKDAIAGETGANAKYKAFAQKAKEDGYINISKMFEAAAEAEAIHISNHNDVLKAMGEPVYSPTPGDVTVKSTKENLESGIEGETYEFTEMYPAFLKDAEDEKNTDAVRSFKMARDAEQIHAGLYDQVLKSLAAETDDSKVSDTWYVCPICGNLHNSIDGVDACAICRAPSSSFLVFSAKAQSIQNLKTAITGETGASAKYSAFAQKAEQDGYMNISKMFKAAAKAEAIHIANHNKVLVKMGELEFSIDPGDVDVKSTKENLESGIEGETYEFTEMYPAFLLTAEEEENADALRTFRFARDAEKIHAGLYDQVLASLVAEGDDSKVSDAWYVCPICGNLHYTIDGVEVCEICRAPSGDFLVF